MAGQRVQVNAKFKCGMHLPSRPFENIQRCQIGWKIARSPSLVAFKFNRKAACHDIGSHVVNLDSLPCSEWSAGWSYTDARAPRRFHRLPGLAHLGALLVAQLAPWPGFLP